ncbi:hypothetical protein DFR31_0281 [Alkalispirillum mobile]|uniref:Uncharacterized protein n=1 Tax=Alkalispirillum mobile TaxID=85925 RepID=A0A498C3X5_9GAMM|nr:hypothetical protein [Alkalispirillum mobile]RLK50385.1 hypothetical protein DFR31_0281 [Alkalispirillum mobile]
MTTALETLRSWVGRDVLYQGRRLRVVELLEDIPDARLVLEECEWIGRQVQADQFGEAHRRAPRIWTLPVHDRDGVSPNPLLDEIVLA